MGRSRDAGAIIEIARTGVAGKAPRALPARGYRLGVAKAALSRP